MQLNCTEDTLLQHVELKYTLAIGYNGFCPLVLLKQPIFVEQCNAETLTRSLSQSKFFKYHGFGGMQVGPFHLTRLSSEMDKNNVITMMHVSILNNSGLV